MPSLCLITVPGLEVSSDWRLVHDRLLDGFPEITDVLATTIKETILVVYEHAAPGDAGRWLDTISETLLHRRQRCGTARRVLESHRGQVAGERRRSPAGAPVGLVK